MKFEPAVAYSLERSVGVLRFCSPAVDKEATTEKTRNAEAVTAAPQHRKTAAPGNGSTATQQHT